MRDTNKILSDIENVNPEQMYRRLDDADERQLAAARRDGETFAKAREAIKTLADIVNGSGNDRIIRAAIVAEMVRTHRYLQNELIFTIIRALGDLGTLGTEEPSRWTDARNEIAYRALATLREKLDEAVYFD